jgi:hypothetical protein
MTPMKHDLTGGRFGSLTAIAHVGRGNWACKCDCGESRVNGAYRLMAGKIISCGCSKTNAKQQRHQRFRSTERITHSELLKILNYDPLTGIFTWRESIARRVRPGDVAGRKSGHGYWGLHIGGRSYAAHHVAWFYMTGQWPAEYLDHINLIRSDNRFANLRPANSSQNGQNTTVSKRNKSGLKGVRKTGSRWTAEIMVNKKAIRLGRFDSAEEASAAYIEAKKKLHSHYIDGQGVRA